MPTVLEKVTHEVELGVVIGKECKNVSENEAMNYVGGYCLSLDMSGMCVIGKNREKGFPWDLGKGFDTSTPISRFISMQELPNPHDIQLTCKVNGQLRQSQSTADLLFTVRYDKHHFEAVIHKSLSLSILDSAAYFVRVPIYDIRTERLDLNWDAQRSCARLSRRYD